MRILDIREISVPLRSSMRNAVFDFSEMTTSVVAVLTDLKRNRQPVIGYSFNSTGRYACGEVMRQRMIPRLCEADPQSLWDPSTGLIDPATALACMMKREKPAGHTERSIAVGTIELAIWDALAKAQDLPLHVLLANRFNNGHYLNKVPCYVGGGWYANGKGLAELIGEIQQRMDEGYTTMKIKVGGATCLRIYNESKQPLRLSAQQITWPLMPTQDWILHVVGSMLRRSLHMDCVGLKKPRIP